jgi:hypothetical protein
VVGASLGRLAESDQFREFMEELVSMPIAAVLDRGASGTSGHATDEAASQPAVITVEIVVCKVENPARIQFIDRQRRLAKKKAELDAQEERERIFAGFLESEISALEDELEDLDAAMREDDSATVRVHPFFFSLACIPEDAVAARWAMTWYQPHHGPGKIDISPVWPVSARVSGCGVLC